MPTTGAVTANEISVTLQAQQAFQEGVAALMSIHGAVFDAQTQLTTTGMVTTAGAKFGGAVQQWCEYFNDIVGTMQWMEEQLGYTAQQLQAGNQEAANAAAALPPPDSFGSSTSFNPYAYTAPNPYS
jgi:hypothetical protein